MLAADTHFVALNEPDSAGGRPHESRELLLEGALAQYTQALGLVRHGDGPAALEALEALARLPLVSERLPPVPDVHGSPIHALQFAVHKNLAAALARPPAKRPALIRAITHLRKARKIDPSDYGCCDALARVALQLNDLETAYSSLHLCVRLAPLHRDRVDALERLVRLLFDAGEFSECLETLAMIGQRYMSQQSQAIHSTILIELLDGDPILAGLEPNIDPKTFLNLQLSRFSQKPIQISQRAIPDHPHRHSIDCGFTLLRLRRGCTWPEFIEAVLFLLEKLLQPSTPSSSYTERLTRIGDPFEHNKRRLIAAPWKIEFIDHTQSSSMDCDNLAKNSPMKLDAIETDKDDTRSQDDGEEGEPSPKRTRRSRQKAADDPISATAGTTGAISKSLSWSDVKELNDLIPKELHFDMSADKYATQDPQLHLKLKQMVMHVALKSKPRKGKLALRDQQPSTASSNSGLSEPEIKETAVDLVFQDTTLVDRFVASLPQQPITVQRLLLRIISDSVIGNPYIGMPGCMHCNWPEPLFGHFFQIVQFCEHIGIALSRSTSAFHDALQQAGMSELHFSLSIAELIFEEQKTSPTTPSLSSLQEQDGSDFATNNALLDASLSGILMRLQAKVRGAISFNTSADDPELFVRLSWLDARQMHASDPTHDVSTVLEPCIRVLKNLGKRHPSAYEQPMFGTAGLGLSSPITLKSVQSLSSKVFTFRLLRSVETGASSSKHRQVVDALLPVFSAESRPTEPLELRPIHQNAREHLFNRASPKRRIFFIECLRKSLDALGRIDDYPYLLLALVREYLNALENRTDGYEQHFVDFPDALSAVSAYLSRQYPHQILGTGVSVTNVSPALDAFLAQLLPISILLCRVSWYVMMAVSENELGLRNTQARREPRDLIGKFVARSWVLYLHIVRLWPGTTKSAAQPQPKVVTEPILERKRESMSMGLPGEAFDSSLSFNDRYLSLTADDQPLGDKVLVDLDDSTDHNHRAIPDTEHRALTTQDTLSSAAKQLGGNNDPSSTKETADRDDAKDMKSDSESEDEEEHHFVGAMDWVHDQLGEIFLCGTDNCSFLKFMMSILSVLDYETHHECINQCYACMYGVVIKIEREAIYEHECEPLPFKRDAAEDIFKLFSPYLIERLSSKSFRSITHDMRDVVDSICKALGDVSRSNSRAIHNSRLLSKFLERDVDPSLIDPVTQLHLGFLELTEDDRVPRADRMVYFVSGAVIWAQYNARHLSTNRAEEAVEELELAIKSLKKHLSLSPLDINAWVLLGQCFHSLAGTLLNWSAIKITQSKSSIATNQRSAFNCFVRAIKLVENTPQATEKLNQDSQLTLWRSMAGLCQSISGKPMLGAALNVSLHKAKEIWKSRFCGVSRTNEAQPVGEANSATTISFQPGQASAPMLQQMAGASLFCARRSLAIDETNIPTHLMLASACRKLGKVSVAVSHCIRACLLAVDDTSPKDTLERALDPLIKLVDTLSVAYHKGVLPARSVVSALQKLSPAIIPTEALSNQRNPESTETATVSDPTKPDPDGVYAILLRVIALNKSFDKKKWHHKPFYRQAWIQFHVFGDAEAAKSEMLHLFQLRTNSKVLKTIWKTELESPGKHYVYIHKYSMFLIMIARVANDVSLLRQLHRRLCKTEEICLHKLKLVEHICESLCTIGMSKLPDTIESVRRIRLLMQRVSAASTLDEAELRISPDALGKDTNTADTSNGTSNSDQDVYEAMIFAIDLRRERLSGTSTSSSLDTFIIASYACLCWKSFVRVQTTRGVDVFSDAAFAEGSSAGRMMNGNGGDDVSKMILRRALKIRK